MTIMTSREFNQHLNQAQKAAQIAPVIVTNRGEPTYVLMSYADYQKMLQSHSPRNALEALTPQDEADIELDIPPRSIKQRTPLEFDE
ncbi:MULTISPECIES: type II toxin-antitoxin system Phd/YefM family antitoxin [unclassified Avibacterium]|uniref:type II toxin-antitoxin system Phd/YefM family antitoxin n=1 Tax=unclassified Avibacterium TaxID=2685287 RepID=UPI0020262A8C|nr:MULTISPECIES: type II toxin-antitoxin system Phd/YefM family antitoxin [unclassified Avibacterium]URL02333.1 type II toxin-antitoxin system Phd/YefM family antitoxin [Avibacterium sp. 20-126]MCW9698789.1 type II toxin-antitoxin system Phd/YefM family antitoxin [Avibacterium sp. 20-129]MCW9717866.1 type II toxin-antitoxin system Phd/YefM family antitoxin [Avibacterium sp. 21-599]MCW9732590.1 type II toxin-antitoxin system Phd/YefM family antitoxin [Avibacterium sp. 20-15]URL04742.1 type II t